MHIDMAALRALEREKDISFDVVVEAIEAALLSAYHKTSGAHAHARVELDRKTGDVTVWARERLDDPEAEAGPDEQIERESGQQPRLSEEFEDTPDDIGR
jgi:N utilization substance protein A